MKPNELVKNFYKHYTQHTYQKGDVLIAPDENALPPIMYVEEGLVAQYDITSEGNRVTVNVFKPGAFFPASSAVNKTPTVYYFEALRKTTVRQAPADDVAHFLQDTPVVTYDLLGRIYRGMEGVLRRTVLLSGESAGARVWHELTIAAERFGARNEGGSIDVGMTASELARQTGLARETVSRELRKLKDTGKVSVRRGCITIRNME